MIKIGKRVKIYKEVKDMRLCSLPNLNFAVGKRSFSLFPFIFLTRNILREDNLCCNKMKGSEIRI